ncbi:MAG: class I SAM-dependent methyltransferase [Kiritimatiellae bacterium]|nr:class I SAM-dependent methyltransferase [Kiritimatiellia bacterium]
MATVQSSLNPVRYLAEEHLMPPSAQCPLCGAPVSGKPARKPIVLQENPVVILVKCSRCRAVSASRLPSAAYLQTYYASYYNEFQNAPRVAFRDIRRFAVHIASGAAPGKPQDTIRLLDYGGGDGRIALETARCLLERAAGRKAEVDCFDLSGTPPAPSPQAEISIRACARPEDFAGRLYHGIIASAVFEHIPHPRPVMKTLLAALEPGGWLYARTPYMVPLIAPAGILGLRIPFGFPAHLHDLGPAFWRRCLAILGLEATHALVRSQPSIIETSLRDYPARTIMAWCLKQPRRIMGGLWPLVGGWEVWIRRAGRD